MDKHYIGIKDLQASCIIGIYSEERKHKQKILIDLQIEYEGNIAVRTDQIDDAIDYDKIREICLNATKEKNYLIEHLANNILDEIFATFSILSMEISIKKPDTYSDATYPYVTIKRDLR